MSSGEPVEREPGPSSDDPPAVTASRASPTRTVFTEEGNTDGWIATDLTVELER